MIEGNATNGATANGGKISCYFDEGVLENLKHFAKKQESSVQAIIRVAVNKHLEDLIQDLEKQLELLQEKVARIEARKAVAAKSALQVESAA